MQNTGVKGGKGGGGKYNISKVYHMHTTVLFYIEVPIVQYINICWHEDTEIGQIKSMFA